MTGPAHARPQTESIIPPGMTFPEIQQAYRAAGYGNADPLSEGERFADECLEWLEGWFDSFEDDELKDKQPFMFLFDKERRPRDVLQGSTPRPSFRSTFELAIVGQIYAADLSLKNVLGVSSTSKTAPELLGYLVQQGWSNITAVAVSPASRCALVHLGERDIDCAIVVPFKSSRASEFDFTQLDSVLETFYLNYVSTHEGDCDVWSKAKNRELTDHAERSIQRSLHGFFKHAVLPKTARVDKEIQTYAGREDIRILRARKDRSLEAAVMELKVLRPTDSPDSLSWAKKGVDQAAAYSAAECGTLLRYACNYDARQSDEAMPEGVKYASAKDVRWRRYFMTTPGCGRKLDGYDS